MFMAAFPPAFFGFMTGITTIVTAPFQFLNIPIYNFIKKNPGLDENLFLIPYFLLLFFISDFIPLIETGFATMNYIFAGLSLLYLLPAAVSYFTLSKNPHLNHLRLVLLF